MLFLKSTVLREALVINDFLIIVNCLIGSRDGKLQLFEINEKRRVKTLPHVASRVIKGIRIIYENETFITRHVCEGKYYFGPRDIYRDLQSLSSIPLLGWKRNR
jgi:hypothetical protein